MMIEEDEDESPQVNIDETDEEVQDTCPTFDDDLDSEGYPFPPFPLFSIPFSLFSYAHPLIPFVNMQREWPHRVLIP
jgi:hypothetical protein